MFDSYVAMQGADRSTVLARFEKRIRESKSDSAKQHAQTDLIAFGNIYDMANKVPIAGPNHPLDPGKLPMAVDLGNLELSIETYPGHSGTDLVVRVPEQRVVYTGDLIFNGAYPACFDDQATISGWRSTLETFASWDKGTLFVPGHGPICGQEGVQKLREVFDDIAEQAEKMYKAGVPASEAPDRYVVPEKFKTLAIWAGNTFPWATSSSVQIP